MLGTLVAVLVVAVVAIVVLANGGVWGIALLVLALIGLASNLAD